MDNETPNYASWIPQAGGYVSNGKVVSKSPIYDENGKLRLDVDVASVAPNTSYSQQASTSYGKIINSLAPGTNYVAGDNSQATLEYNMVPAGSTTTNTSGSGTDVNSLMTGAGSMASLNNNTATTAGVLSTPATTSPNANLKPSQISGKSMDDLLADFAWFQSEGNYQGMINTLTQMSAVDGQDRTALINEYQNARNKKIMSQDDKYLQAINEAQKTGDYETATALQNQQQLYRDSVGYEDAMKKQYDTEMEGLDLEYQFTWQAATNDLTNAILQSLQGIINFQYDPFKDTALQIAQQYATSRVKEQMNSTGMYYSSMTQSAIAKVVAELVPQYQKMAREEAIENLQLLQSTANYLMNLEEQQFDMWKAQIELKWEANQEKRRQVQAAIESSNARGYVNNEEAVWLGVPAGTESYEERQRMEAKQDEIEKEARQLEQSKALESFKTSMALQEYEQKLLIQKKYGIGDFAPSSSGGGGTYEVEYDADGNVISYKYKGSNPPSSIGGAGTTGEGTVDTTFLNQFKNDDGSYDETKVQEYIKTNIKEAAQSSNAGTRAQAAAELDALQEYYINSKLDEISAKFGFNPFTTTSALKEANKAITKFDGWLEDAGVSEEGKTMYKQRAAEYLRNKVNQADKFQQVTDFNAFDYDASKENAVSNIEKTYGLQSQAKSKASTANYSPIITGDKAYVPESQIQKSKISGKISYIVKDDNTSSAENYIPVSKDNSTGLYYYMSENTSDGKLRKVYVDKNQVKTTALKSIQGIVLDDNGNATLDKNIKDPARVRFVAKDDKTGQYYYIKY